MIGAYDQCIYCETWHCCRFKRKCTNPKGHAWSCVPDARQASDEYGLEDGRGCVPEDERGCDARKKLGVARGALLTVEEDLEVLLTALHPVMMVCQSDGGRRLLLECMKKVKDALLATTQPQICNTKEET